MFRLGGKEMGLQGGSCIMPRDKKTENDILKYGDPHTETDAENREEFKGRAGLSLSDPSHRRPV